MTRRLAPILIALLLATATGCDGGNEQSAPPPQTTSSSTTGVAELKRTVRAALGENRRLSVFVLWNNTIPSWAERSTRGPALASLRTAAKNRRSRGVRVRVLESTRDVLSLRIDPSFRRATATVRDRQRVQPSRRDGRPLGRSEKLDERARYELRRIQNSDRFVVWRVVLLQ